MAELDDLPFTYPDARQDPPLVVPARCRRHRWVVHPDGTRCDRCSRPYDADAAKRGRNNRSRGNAIEREVARKLGLRRTGQFGGPDDAAGDWLVVQVKSGGAFPERIWAWLQALPSNAQQTRAVVVTDAPGPGRRRRAVVIVDLDDWAALHGETAA